jgi:hypothetical protein
MIAFRRLAYADHEAEMLPGDLLLYRATAADGLVDVEIARFGRSPWCHAAMVASDPMNPRRLLLLEMIQFHGGRCRSLLEAVRENPGHWDHFRANRAYRWHFNRGAAVARMQKFVGRPYGWHDLLRDAALHLPLVRAFTPAQVADTETYGHTPYCSEAVDIATRAGGVDPVPFLPGELTEPGDLARSLFFEYQGTLVP